jgi:hypothetical protein
VNPCHAAALALVVLSDRCLFLVFEASLFALYLYAMWRARRSSRPVTGPVTVSMEVKRGEKGRALLYGFYGAISIVLLNIPLRVEIVAARDYRVMWVLFNLSIAAYLCLFNSWFRNKIIEWVGKFENLIERATGS